MPYFLRVRVVRHYGEPDQDYPALVNLDHVEHVEQGEALPDLSILILRWRPNGHARQLTLRESLTALEARLRERGH